MQEVAAAVHAENRSVRVLAEVCGGEYAKVVQELAQARQREAATTEILGIISRSPTSLQPVLDGAAGAADLCEALDAAIFRVDGGRDFLHDANVVYCRLADGMPWKRRSNRTSEVKLLFGISVMAVAAALLAVDGVALKIAVNNWSNASLDQKPSAFMRSQRPDGCRWLSIWPDHAPFPMRRLVPAAQQQLKLLLPTYQRRGGRAQRWNRPILWATLVKVS